MAAPEPARHLVRRATIELVTTDEAGARALGHRAEALALGALRRILERELDSRDPAEGLVRIERLEVDLGRMPLATVETDLPEAFARALPAALARALPDASPGEDARAGHGAAQPGGQRLEPTDRATELVASVARTGRPPWWHDPSGEDALFSGAAGRPPDEDAPSSGTAGAARPASPPLLTRALARLLEMAPDRARDLLRRLAAEPRSRRRLAVQLDAETFTRCVTPLAPAGADIEALTREAEAALAATPEGMLMSAGDRRPSAREALLAVLSDPPTDIPALIAALRNRLAMAPEPDRTATAGRPTPTAAAAEPSASVPAANARAMGRSLADELLMAADHVGWAADLLRVLAPAANDLRDSAAVRTALRELLALGSGAASDRANLTALLRPFLAAGVPGPPGLETALAPLRSRLRAAGPATPTAIPTAEGIAVDNAGLCLLWPFLPALFAEFGLLDEARQWRDPLSTHRAAELLDRIATGEPTADETRLPLPKLLCGLAPDDVHEPSEIFDASEHVVLDGFLAALLTHCTPLGHLSVDGLRGSWLLRPGLIEGRDGLPLLRVERRGYDILLDRLPWPREWVRLSWMPLPLRVEW